MKNIKKILFSLLILISIFTIVSCTSGHEHSYDNDCDITCNTCGEKRIEIGHVGGTATCTKLAKCTVCGVAYGDYAACVFSTEVAFCDATTHGYRCTNEECRKVNLVDHRPSEAATEEQAQVCLDCGYIITPQLAHTHKYGTEWQSDDTSHWHACSGCEEKGSNESHIYDNNCDTSCNTCGYTRPVTHNYSNECDSDCDTCGFTRITGLHVYDNDCDTKCNLCDAERTIEHTWDNGQVRLEATCKEDGLIVYTCTVCQIKENKTLPITTHNYVEDVVSATCTNIGYTEYTCRDCGDSYKGNYVSALGHTYTETKIPATCTEGGYSVFLCSCGHTYNGNYIAPTGHKYVETPVEPTCTTVGYIKYLCTCGDTYNANYVAKTGHIYTENFVAPTCTERGYTEYLCSCGDSYNGSYVAALGHEHKAPEREYEIPSTCKSEGYYEEVIYCATCEAELKRTEKVSPKLPHTEEILPAVSATCISTGLTEGKKCSECNEVLVAQVVITSSGHSPEAPVKENEVAATCSASGSYEEVVYCGVCEAELSRNNKTIAKLPHTEETVAAVAPTCTTTGLTEGKKCSVCDEVLTIQSTVSPTGHTPAEAVKEKEVAPTCTTVGSYEEVVYCLECDAELGRTAQTVAALGHTSAEAVVENNIPATCKVAGSYDEVVFCSACDAELSRTTKENARLPHTEEVVPAVEASCTATGLSVGKKCSVCNEVLEAQIVTPALGHTKGAPVKENEVAATCTAAGSYNEVVYCSVCTNKLSTTPKTTDKLPHSYSTDWSNDAANHWHECSCLDRSSEEAHNYVSETITPATETVEGKVKHTCTVCEYSYIQNIGTLDHVHTYESKLTYDAGYHWYAPTCNPNHEVKDKVAHNYTWKTKTAATCTTAEVLEGTCDCGYVTTKINGDALGHSPAQLVIENEVAATCTTAGSYDEVVYCSVCDVELSRNSKTINALGHDPLQAVVENNIPATCKAAGSYDEVVYCNTCDAELSRNSKVNARLPHTETVVPAVAATCTATGLTEGKKCSVCNEVLVAQTVIPALGHTPKEAIEENRKEATCKAAGSYDTVVYCDTCDAELSRTTNTIAKLPHTEEVLPSTQATCTTAGSTEGKKCSVCNEVLVAQTVIPALGHTASEAVEVNRKEPTCTAAGSYDLVVYCSVCDAEISKSTKTLAAKGHTASAAVEENRKEATCKVAGSYDEVVKCSVCNSEISRTTKPIAKLPHTEQIVPAVAATCTSAGLTEGKKCSVCNALLAVQTTVPALGHSYSEVWSTNETNHWHECHCGAKKQNDIHVYGEGEVLKAPTETTEGQTKYTCTTCQYSYIKTEGVLSHTHKFADTLSKNETHHWYAATCGHDEVKDKVAHTWDNGTITKNATCVTPGVKTYSCQCGQTKTEEIPTVAHQYTNRCDEECNVCGLMREVTHVYDSGVITKAATCTTSGIKTYTCELGCGKSYTETIAATGHQYDNACDDECNNCYADRVVGDHVYDDFIDVHCNECNYKREARFAYESRYYHTLRYSTHSNDDYGLVPYFEIREQADGTYVTEISSLRAWSFLRFYFNGQLITRNDVSFEGVVAANYDEAANSTSFKLYFDGDGIYDTAQLNTPYGGEQMIRIVFNPNTKTIKITTISEETNYFDEVENVRFSSLYLVANNKTTFELNMEVPYDDYYTVALNSVYSSFVAYDEYGNKVLELSGKTSKQIYLEQGMILRCTAKTTNSSAAVDLTITLSEHYSLYPYDPQEFVDGDALLAQDKSHVTGDVPSAVIRYEKRKGGLYINCNNPEKLNENQYNQGLTRDDVSNKEVFFTFEHNNYAVKNFYYGYQVKNTGSEDIYVTVKNIGLHIDGSGCWLGEKEWIHFYNTNFKVKGYNSYTSSQKANFAAYISFGMNYKSQNYQPITYRVAPGTYIWVMGGTSADAYGNVNVYGTANYKVTSSCSNGAVLFDVLGEGAIGTFYIYQNASKVGYSNNTHYGYTTGTNPVGHDYGEQYKGSDYCHGVVDGYMTFEFNDNHGVSEDIYLPVEYTNKIESGAATNGTKYAAFNVVNNNVSQWSWYTHINPQNNNSAIGTDMTAYHTVDKNGNPIVIDYLHRDGRGQAANIGNWMIDYMDHYTFVNHGRIDRKVTVNMYHSGVIAVLVRNPDGSIRSDFTPQYAVRLASSASGAAIEDLFEYTVTVPAGCYVQFVVEYNLLANASGNIQHNVLLHKKGS